MRSDEVLARLRVLIEPWLRDGRLRLGTDDLGNVTVFTRMDLTHLDADALTDRLHAWTKRVAGVEVDGADAHVSFRHARPATHDEATLDLQEKWLDLEPTLRLEMDRPRASGDDVERFARLVPGFVEQLDRTGRPHGWRRVDEGNAE